MKTDMIVFAEDWGHHPSSTQHLFKHLSCNRKTLWVNSIGLRRPRLNFRDLHRLSQKGRAFFNRAQAGSKPPAPVEVMAPKAIPWPGNALANRVNRIVLGRQIAEQLSRLEMTKPVLWTSLPSVVDVMDAIEHRAVVYYCGDDFAALAGVDHGPVAACEKRLSERSDLIIAASDQLADKFPAHKTIVLPHGVDFDLFSNRALVAEPCRTKRPIAGFYGSIASWLDLDLIANSARALPDWDFMLVGDVQTDVSVFKGIPNIKLIAAQPHAALPGFVQNWQAALLPFRDCAQIQACNPLKLREYLASGTPVVSSAFPALGPYLDHVTVVSASGELVRALKEITPNVDQVHAVAGESWSQRAHDLEQLLSLWDG